MKERLLLFFVLWIAGSEALAACYGRVLNPVTDIPWDGVFPITVAGARLSKAGINSPTTDAAPVCACQKGPILKAGVNMSFFEPIRTAEVVREPFCFPSLGGISIDSGLRAPAHGRSAARGRETEAGTILVRRLSGKPLSAFRLDGRNDEPRLILAFTRRAPRGETCAGRSFVGGLRKTRAVRPVL